MPIREYLRRIFEFLKSKLLQLNLFNTGVQNETIIQNERRSTRLYLVLLITSMAIITTYYSIISYTKIIVIQSPSLNEYSNIIEETSLQCPCSNIAVKYEIFATIEPNYHELCESDFISDEWINHLFRLYEHSWNKSIPTDFRRIGVFQFQTLRSFCQLVKDTINNDLQSFNYTDFVQSHVVFPKTFQAQIDSFIKEFIDGTSKTFLRILNFLQDTTAQSLFMTGASITSVRPVTQFRLRLDLGIVPYPGINYTFKDGSSCVCSSSTATTCMGLATFDNNIVSGFQTGCYMLSALMNSTLEVLYNQTFINMLSNSSKNFKKLESFNSNWKIEMLLSQMFVKSWLNRTSYDKYFQSCAPESCSYRKIQHYSFWSILLVLIGLFGGLSSVLKILTPILILNIWPIIWKIICRRQSRATQLAAVEVMPATSIGMRMKMLFQFIKRTLIELNLFKSIPPSDDETILRRQLYQTRLYLILLLISLIILTFVASMQPPTISIKVESPSVTSFVQLYDQYPFTLDCPCSQTTLEYNQFIFDIKAQLHEICSSDFITSRWIDLQFIESPVRVFFTNDIRYQSQMHFKLLSTLCRVANQTINENLQSLYRTKFTTNKVITPSSFKMQTDLIIEQFKRTVPGSYQRALQLIEINPEINQLVVPLNSAFSSTKNFYINEVLLLKPARNDRDYRPICGPGVHCSCFFMFPDECVLETIISKGILTKIIPGMIQTVFPLRSVLLSTLECFYNDTCLSYITREINSLVSPTNFSTLHLSLLSINETQYDRIDMLANKLFVRSWNNQSSYQSYFNQCHPLTCQYTYESRFNIIYIITTVIGMLGGLNIVLKLLIPYVINLSFLIWIKVIHRRQNTTRTTVATVSTRRGKEIHKNLLGSEYNMTLFFRDRLQIAIRYIKKSVSELDLFPTIPPSQDEKVLRRNRRLTRIYLTLLFICLLILAVYTSITQETITVTVESPSISKYSELSNQYPLTFQCSCNNISIKNGKFITQMKPQYHPICSSEFFSSDRYNTTWSSDSNKWQELVFDDDDFRNFIKSQLNMVSKMCSLSQKTLNSSLSLWFQNDFITARVISPIEFNTRKNELIEEFKRITTNELMLLFKLLQVTNFANQLATVRSSNWQFVVSSMYDLSSYNIKDSKIYQNALFSLAVPQIYNENNCSCALHPYCSKFSTFLYRIFNQSLRQSLPAFRTGCLPQDAMLQSSFSCFFNETCLYILQTSIYFANSFPINLLTTSSVSSSNRTIETILGQLFVEQWFEKVSFDLYYKECAPRFCQYSYSLTFNRVYFVTTVLAVMGGLAEVLHYALSCITLIVIKLFNRQKKIKVILQSNTIVVESDNTIPQIISNPPMTTAEINVNPVQEQIEISENRTDRTIIICLCLLVVVAIVAASVICVRNGNTKYVSPTAPITTLVSNVTVVGLTTTSTTQSCHMTLTYQSDAYPIGHGAKSLTVRDFNRDSFLDLAVTNHDDHTISILFGNGNGTFQTQHVYSIGNESYPWGIVSADFNKDGFPDIAVTLSKTGRVAIFFGIASNGSFNKVPHTFIAAYSGGSTLQAIEANDLNDDGFIDLLLGNDYLYASLNLGDGRKYTSTRVNFPEVQNVELIVIGDFDHDGKQNDISVCSVSIRVSVTTLSNITYQAHQSGTAKLVANLIYGIPQSIIRGRFNDDELDDIALVAPESDTLHVLLAYGDGTFLQQIYHTDNYPIAVVLINFNNDLIDDLAILTCNQTLTIYLGTKLGIFYHHDKISFQVGVNSSNQCFRSPRVADLNHDGKDDLVFIDPDAQSIRVLLGASCS